MKRFGVFLATFLLASGVMAAEIFNLTDSWNSGSTTFDAIKMVVTDSASATDSKLLNITGTSGGVFQVNKLTGLTMTGTASMAEQATANADVAGYGQVWVKTATPNQLWFTDDAGTDLQLGTGSGDLKADGTVPLTANWDAGAFNLASANFTGDYFQFDLTYVDGTAEGRLQWNSTDGTMEVGMPGGNVNLQLGQELLVRVRNNTGVQIDNGSAVYISGSHASGNLEISLAQADSLTTAFGIGIATEDIADSSFGFINTFGLVRGIDTFGFTEGALVYLSETVAGSYQQDRPVSGSGSAVVLGYVIKAHATDGILAHQTVIVPQYDRASGIELATPSDGNALRYVLANTQYEFFSPVAVGDNISTLTNDSGFITTVEGTAVLSTGEIGGSKFLREDGDGTSSWQTVAHGLVQPLTAGITAFATGGQANATLLTSLYNVIGTVGTAGDSVKLESCSAGTKQTIINSGANILDLFPNTSDAINQGSVDVAVSVGVNNTVTFICIDATTWVTL